MHAELVRRFGEANLERHERATAGALEALPTTIFEEGVPPAAGLAAADASEPVDTPECCLCMEAFEKADELRVLPCRHYFHRQCIDRWFSSRAYQVRLCPLCRVNPLAPSAVTEGGEGGEGGGGEGGEGGGGEGGGAAAGSGANLEAALEGGLELQELGSAPTVVVVPTRAPPPRNRPPPPPPPPPPGTSQEGGADVSVDAADNVAAV